MNRLEQAQVKYERLKTELAENNESIEAERKLIPFGQPNIIGKPDIYKNINRKEEKSRKLYEELQMQKHRIEMLEKVNDFKEENELLQDVHVVGKSSYATVGARTSVRNLDYFKNELKELEDANRKAKAYNKTKPAIKSVTYGAKITKLKRKIADLEQMQERDQTKVLSEKTQKLIDSGAVNQWPKKPIYYFVKGLKKVALEIDDNGDFYISRRYSPWSEEDKKFVEDLLRA